MASPDISLHGTWSPELTGEQAVELASAVCDALSAAGYRNVNVITNTGQGRSPQGFARAQKHIEIHMDLP